MNARDRRWVAEHDPGPVLDVSGIVASVFEVELVDGLSDGSEDEQALSAWLAANRQRRGPNRDTYVLPTAPSLLRVLHATVLAYANDAADGVEFTRREASCLSRVAGRLLARLVAVEDP